MCQMHGMKISPTLAECLKNERTCVKYLQSIRKTYARYQYDENASLILRLRKLMKIRQKNTGLKGKKSK